MVYRCNGLGCEHECEIDCDGCTVSVGQIDKIMLTYLLLRCPLDRQLELDLVLARELDLALVQ